MCIDGYQQHFALTGGCVGKNNFIANKFFLLGMFIWGLTLIVIIPVMYFL